MYQVEPAREPNLYTKHIFVGETRLVSRVGDEGQAYGGQNGEIYYYHPDHLGNTTWVTDNAGAEYEHIEYTPYGESWVDEGRDSLNRINYMFTSKELDAETGLYYFGARYLDPKTSRWMSADPAMSEYLPAAGKGADGLPGMGGVFSPVNLVTYHYGANNPLKYVDPTGEDTKDIGYGKYVDTSSGRIIKTTIGNRIENLMTVQDSTRTNPIYQINAGGPFHRNPSDGLVWCNQGAFDVAEATGVNISALLGNESRWDTNANEASRGMAANARSFVTQLVREGIRAPGAQLIEVNAKNAQSLANIGFTVVSAWENVGGIGHLGTVRPDTRDFNSNRGPLISNIGTNNYIRYAIEAYAVGGVGGAPTLQDIHYYYDPNQTFEFNPLRANREF
jgi:RHS repeat-associated protein